MAEARGLLRRHIDIPGLRWKPIDFEGLVRDLTYDIHTFERGVSGGVGSRRQLRTTRDRVLALCANRPGTRILAAHDPAAAGLLDAATTTPEYLSPWQS